MKAFSIDIDESTVLVYGGPVTKHEALSLLVDAVATTGAVDDPQALVRAVLEREAVMSTGIGAGVAIPHVRIPQVSRPCIGIGISHAGIEYDALDNQPVQVIILFAMPAQSQKAYLGLLAQVMVAMKDSDFAAGLMACATPAQVVAYLNQDTP